ncbi:hypothetical protein TEA_029224 [Camellia sinensis var. sinensis]|uniref:Fatty acid hydroxylase domain-containing protein n=1 Tax=Camellia sinensis var. sinensis TaxID=542762 RepID=A0A4S4E953_CAMSN|nr:hypothetical protein TEA_029224 [Camellia sinensis var. sinensis]
MSNMVATLSAWPWENLGPFKYLLYGPLIAKVFYSRTQEGTMKETWCLHILILCLLRSIMYQLWTSFSNMLFLTRNRRILQQGVDFKQIDKEWDWDNFIILQALIASMVYLIHPVVLTSVPLLDSRGFITVMVLHMGVSEPVYYWVHKCFHGKYLFTQYHSLHHSSPLPQPYTAGHAAVLEHLILTAVIGIPVLGTCKNGRVPDFVFLAHVVDITSSLHSPFVFRSFASTPFRARLFLVPLWPFTFVVMLVMWAKSKTFLFSFYNLRGYLQQTWVVPRFGFQYFLPFAKEGINNHIEEAILRADKLGVKNEALNGGGTLFVNKHPNLRVRVVHGNTLTAAVILNEISEDVKEVFLTGATSKLGRAIALYLCRRRVRVLMLTLSTERFQNIQKEAPAEVQKYLVQVTKYHAAQKCKAWIVGKWITPREQSWAPSGAHFHQFVVPPILAFRRDCTYGDLAAMKLPHDVEGLGSCEYTMERGVVHACHAGGVIHLLEGWTHHEVGAIDVDRIDLVWRAALKHGLKPVSSLKKAL